VSRYLTIKARKGHYCVTVSCTRVYFENWTQSRFSGYLVYVPTIRSEKKLQTRQAILRAALTLSSERGFAGLSLREVASQAGIAPNSFYRHFANMDELALSLVDEIGLSLRQLVREARRRVESRGTSVVRASIETFMDYVKVNGNLFRLLLVENAGSSQALRLATNKEMERFIVDLVEDLTRASEVKQRPIENIPVIAEAMARLVFTMGAQALDADETGHHELTERMIYQVRIIMKGAEASAAGWNPFGERLAR
jgi:TetR/AcrR family transcriptional regulator, fatty acid biosynthesis regulator